MESINRPTTSTEIETVMEKTPLTTNKHLGADDFTDEYNQTFGEELTSILLKQFQKISEKGTLPNSLKRSPSP